MSKLQPQYDQAKKKEKMIEIPALMKQIKDYQTAKNNEQDPNIKKAFDARIKALQIKVKSIKMSDPVIDKTINASVEINNIENIEEEKIGEDAVAASPGGVTTSSIGSTTRGTGDGGTEPAPFGNSSIYAKSVGVLSRRKFYPPKKNKKKKIKEFVEFYFKD